MTYLKQHPQVPEFLQMIVYYSAASERFKMQQTYKTTYHHQRYGRENGKCVSILKKCIVIGVPGKRQFHQTSYTLHGHILDVVDSGKYPAVTINKDLTWTKHINQTTGKASKTIGFLRRNLGRCTTKSKATAYTTLVRPDLEYASPVWDPHQITTTRDIEQVQRRAARFAYNCYQDNSPGCEHVSRLMQSENGISIYIYISVDLCNQKTAYYCCFTYF